MAQHLTVVVLDHCSCSNDVAYAIASQSDTIYLHLIIGIVAPIPGHLYTHYDSPGHLNASRTRLLIGTETPIPQRRDVCPCNGMQISAGQN